MALPVDALPDGGQVLSCAALLDHSGRADAYPWTGKPASGGKGAGKPASEENTFLMRDCSGAGHWLREATVTGLPELFSSFGNMATARELYEWWGQARVIVHKRLHGRTNPVRREAARRHHEGGSLAGHWQP